MADRARPTVVNEHGVVLGLTNDEWSYLGTAWQALLVVGVVAACSLHRGRLRTIAGTLAGPLPVAPDAVFSTLPFAFGTGVEYQDVIALCDAAAWAALGLALRGSLRRTLTAPGPASGHAPTDEGVSSPRSR